MSFLSPGSMQRAPRLLPPGLQVETTLLVALLYISKCDISNNDMEVKDRPLSSAALHILLALAESNLHGYGIMQSVKRQSGGNYRLGPGTLYANLDRLLASGLVGENERRLKSGDTRREYCLTPSGEHVLRLEVRRLRQVVDTARTRLGKLDERGA